MAIIDDENWIFTPEVRQILNKLTEEIKEMEKSKESAKNVFPPQSK